MTKRGRSTTAAEQKATALFQIALIVGVAFALAGTSTSAMLTSPLHSSSAKATPETLNFDMDACGNLQQIENRDSMITKTSAKVEGDDSDGDEDDDNPDGSQNAWGMSDMGAALVHQWLLDHPQALVVTDTVQRACRNGAIETDDDALEIA